VGEIRLSVSDLEPDLLIPCGKTGSPGAWDLQGEAMATLIAMIDKIAAAVTVNHLLGLITPFLVKKGQL
jgi:hypothetical protein